MYVSEFMVRRVGFGVWDSGGNHLVMHADEELGARRLVHRLVHLQYFGVRVSVSDFEIQIPYVVYYKNSL